MKRIVSVLLTLIMLMSIIPLSTLSASAASNNNGWVEVETYELYGNREITILKEDIDGFCCYTSRLKFIATSIETRYGRNFWGKSYEYKQKTTLSYTTKKHTKYFSDTPFTVKEIIARDSKLNKTGIYSIIENIFLCEWLRDDPGGCITHLGYEELWYGAVADIKTGMVYDSLANALGSGSEIQDIYCLIMDAIDSTNSTKAVQNKVKGMVTVFGLAADDNRCNAIITENENALYNIICNKSNSKTISTYQ